MPSHVHRVMTVVGGLGSLDPGGIGSFSTQAPPQWAPDRTTLNQHARWRLPIYGHRSDAHPADVREFRRAR